MKQSELLILIRLLKKKVHMHSILVKDIHELF